MIKYRKLDEVKRSYSVQMWETIGERCNSWYSLNHTTVHFILIKLVIFSSVLFSKSPIVECQIAEAP